MQRTKIYPQKKVDMYKNLIELSQKHKVIALIKMERVRATQLMQVRKKFRDELKIMMIKNNVAKKALVNIKVKGMDRLMESLEGQRAMVFTDMDPFKLYLALDKSKIYLPAKGGDVATEDVAVSAGNTGIPPGPVLSEFKEAKVPTRIDSGSIWIAEDTVVAEPGQVISHKLASLLGKLGIKPVKAGMSIYLALQEGVVYRDEDLRIDIEQVAQELLTSFNAALSLAVNASYATKESIEHLVRKAFGNARSLAVNSGYSTSETIKEALYGAHLKSLALYESLKKSGYS
ncbi:MAG: 50S ribosomal protein L10 [Nitrososphaerales archaeon]